MCGGVSVGALVFNGSRRRVINPLRALAEANPTGTAAGSRRGGEAGCSVTQVGRNPDRECLTSPFAPSVHYHNKSPTGCLRSYRRAAEKSVAERYPGRNDPGAKRPRKKLKLNNTSGDEEKWEWGIYRGSRGTVTPGNVKSAAFHPARSRRRIPLRGPEVLPRQMKSLDVQELRSTRIPIGTETSVDNEQRASGDGSRSDLSVHARQRAESHNSSKLDAVISHRKLGLFRHKHSFLLIFR